MTSPLFLRTSCSINSPLARMGSAVLLSAIASAAVQAQQGGGTNPGDPSQLPEVEVRAQRSLNERFNSPGSRVIVTKEDIENMGADTVTDVLRQLPGVTTSTGANGQTEIRMRGMDRGATQILVDGERQNNARRGGGLPIDQIPADLIERVEVIRSPMAEFSGASGGTINIVLKQAVIQRETTARLANQHQFDKNAASFFFGRTGPFYEPPADNNKRPINERVIPPTYFFGMSVFERIGGNDRSAEVTTNYASGPKVNNPDLETRDETFRSRTAEVMMFPRASFRISAKDQLNVNFFVNGGKTKSWADSTSVLVANNLTNASTTTDFNEADRSTIRMSALWNHRFTGSRLETRISLENGGEKNNRTSNTTIGTGQSAATAQLDDRNEKSWLVSTKLTASETTHIWTFGGEVERRDFETDTTTTISNGLATSTSQGLYNSGSTRLSAFVQDEWTVLNDATFTTGLRVERLNRKTDSTGTVYQDSWTRFQPNLNLRMPINKEHQFRVGLSGVNRIPALTDVIDRVILSTGPNSSTRPDNLGNPTLKAEKTLSLDTGTEFRNAKGVQWGINAFLRHSKDPVIRPTTLVNGRWVQQPINGLNSRAYGIETDLRAPLTPLGLNGFFLNASAALLASKVDLTNGQSGRIPGQPHYTVNINVNKPISRTGGWIGGAVLNLSGASDLADTSTSGGRVRSVARLDLRIGYVVPKLGLVQLGVNNVTNADRDRVRYDLDPTAGISRTETIIDSGGRSLFLAFATRF